MKIGSLFSGYGGLEMGVRDVLGGQAVWHCEYEPPTKKNPRPSQAAARVLAHRFPGVPNHGDITAVDWSAVEPVDVATMGFPCQDLSGAGLRKGLRPGTRSGLWTHAAYAIDQLRPRLVVIENVRGLLSAGAHHPAHGDLEPCPWEVGEGSGPALRALGAVLGDLADIGYDASWQGLHASDVGAPHGRFRVFVTAWPAEDADLAARGERWLAAPGQAEGRRPRPDAGGRDRAPVADTGGGELQRRRVGGVLGGASPAKPGEGDQRQRAGHSAGDGGAVAADAASVGWTGRNESRQDVEQDGPQSAHAGSPRRAAIDWGHFEPAIRRWESLTRPAPNPTERGKNGQPRLSPAFVEWMQGLPAGWVTDVPRLTRNEQLKALGNGVVPQQAAQALRMLLPDVAEVAA